MISNMSLYVNPQDYNIFHWVLLVFFVLRSYFLSFMSFVLFLFSSLFFYFHFSLHFMS